LQHSVDENIDILQYYQPKIKTN